MRQHTSSFSLIRPCSRLDRRRAATATPVIDTRIHLRYSDAVHEAVDLIAFGNPILDHFAFPPEDERRRLLRRYGLPDGGARHMESGEIEPILSELAPATCIPAGGAFNTVRIYAQLGGGAAFCGSAGYDGAPFRRELSDCGIHDLMHADDRRKSGRSLTLLTPGQAPLILVAPGAAAAMPPHRPSGIENAAAGGDSGEESRLLFFLEGFLLENPELIRVLLSTADELGARIAFDPGAPGPAADHRDLICEEILPRCEYLFARRKELEALRLTPSELPGRFDIEAAVEKRGDAGSVIYTRGQRYPVPAFPARSYETTGTGDLFAGAFLAALCRGAEPRQAGIFGARAGAHAAETAGGRLDPPAVELLRSLLP